MNRHPSRQQAMLNRLLALIVALTCTAALAQNEDFTPPPMVPADQPLDQPPAQPNGQPQYPQPQQPQQPQNGQPQQYQPYQPYPTPQDPQQYPNQQYPQQQPYPNQQYPQQQPYPNQQYPQQQQYPNQQYPQQQQPYYQQRPQPQQNPAQQTKKATTFMESTKTKHFVGLLSGSLGLVDTAAGVVGSARGEFDISRFGFLAAYNAFLSSTTNIQIHQFNIMAGWAFFTSDELTLRALAGVDIMTRDQVTGTGPMFGVNVRSMFGRIGVDGALMLTVFPFRQLEARAAFVVGWSIFELHIGWRIQVIDATQSGTFGTLFTTAPGINGPVVGIGITL